VALKQIPVGQIEPHPKNPNSMAPDAFKKLQRHIERTSFYPPVIVRPLDDGRYQMIDGWHRYLIVRDHLKRDKVAAIVAEVSETEADMMLATLNRLHGEDDPRARAELVSDLLQEYGSVVALADLLPESQTEINTMLKNLENGFGGGDEPEPDEPGEKKKMKLQFTADQWLVIGEALSIIKRRAGLGENEVERCFEFLAADWLGGQERVESRNLN
jgi:ParB/RepB/Spo0J family partition protein